MYGSGRVFRVSPSSFSSFLFALVLLAVTLSDALASERQLVVIEGADYFGLDYETLEGVELAACKAACILDPRCLAFTYNTKARWCFLKSDYGDLRAFEGAISGHIAQGGIAKPDLEAVRISELGFLRRVRIDEARQLADRLARRSTAVAGGFDAIIAEAQAARRAGNPQRAVDLYAAALKLAPESTSLWVELADALSEAKPENWKMRQRFREDASAAAVNGYLRSETGAERARALVALGRTLAGRSDWKPAIRAYRAALALVDDPQVRAAYEKLVAEHGFRVTEHQVDSDALNPRICVQFSDPLERQRANLSDFVRVEGGSNLAVEFEQQQVCVDGVVHGKRYRILLRAGLPAVDGEKLSKKVDLDVYVRDRSPSVRFLGRAYVLPKGGEARIPIVSVNTDRVEVEAFRVGDRAMARAIGDGSFLKQLSSYETNQLGERFGEKVWTGTVDVRSELNRDLTTAVPVAAMIRDFKPGAYVMTAKPRDAAASADALATQWFVVSDIGLAGFSGNDGLHAVVRSLSGAGPLGGVALRLVALNDEVLGRASTDDTGYARFEPGLLRGTGGNAPALLVAEGPDGDYGFLDLTKSPFDLTDRGVDGRPAPKPLDVYFVSERGVYRPGETVHLTALMRDAKANASTDLPLTVVVKRPDGVEQRRALTTDQGLGGRHLEVALAPSAMRGTWRAMAYADPKGQALAELSFLVEDFEPERLTFDLKSPVAQIAPDDPPAISVSARFLYGAPASNLELEGSVSLKPLDTLAAFPGFRFGLSDEKVEPLGQPIPSARTDEQGNATIALDLPKMAPGTKPLEADVAVRLLDTSGRPVERSIKV
ncbi:MAG: MG2 domain-containing protein, partial [Pseudomonadota bacterium]|nr:MG2 domain-containing protein [Pseudomonadota bacterium]